MQTPTQRRASAITVFKVNGDVSALAAVMIETYLPIIYGRFRTTVGYAFDVDDLVQELFIRLIGRMDGKIDITMPTSSIESYLFGMILFIQKEMIRHYRYVIREERKISIPDSVLALEEEYASIVENVKDESLFTNSVHNVGNCQDMTVVMEICAHLRDECKRGQEARRFVYDYILRTGELPDTIEVSDGTGVVPQRSSQLLASVREYISREYNARTGYKEREK